MAGTPARRGLGTEPAMRHPPAAVILLAPALAVAQPCDPDALFTRTDFPGIFNPTSIAVADLNGDTYPDIAIATSANTVAVLINDTASGLLAPVSYATLGTGAAGIAAGDLDGDTDIDLVVVHNSSDNFAVLRNNGNGTFATAVLSAAGADAEQVALVDVDNDDALDLVIVTEPNPSAVGRLLIRFGNGDGTFRGLDTYDIAVRPYSIALGRFNDDEHTDIAVGYSGDVSPNLGGGVRVFLGSASGDLTPLPPVHDVGFARNIIAADLDADGDDDIAFVSTPGILAVLLNDGAAGFTPLPSIPAIATASGIATADFDLDSYPDIVVTSFNNQNLWLHVNIGAAHLEDGRAYPSPSGPQYPAAIDIDRDGDSDVALVAWGAGLVSVFYNPCGPFEPRIETQPECVLVDQGEAAVLGVDLLNQLPAPSYQWRRRGVPLTNGGAISGATSATLVIDPATQADVDEYDVVITNSEGQATSRTAFLAVRNTCPADLDVPFGFLDFSDVFAYLVSFGAGCP